MKTKLNSFFWLIICLSFTAIFTYLLISNKIINYLHPKMIKYIIFAVIIWFSLSLRELVKIKSTAPKKERFKLGYLLFLLPICLSLIGNANFYNGISNNKNTIRLDAAPKSLDINNEKEKLSKAALSEAKKENKNTSNNQSKAELASEELTVKESKIKTGNENITETETTTEEFSEEKTGGAILKQTKEAAFCKDEFLNTIVDLQHNIKERIGTKTSLKGFVYRAPNYKSNQFMVARMIITCCAADACVVGLMVETENASDYTTESWVEITGIVDSFEYHDENFGTTYQAPIVKNPTVTIIEPLESPYVYP